ncbi:hypothetical protein [Nocardioides dongkuii]|uniref:hypothetical protein n=1 Tax=Nocardioides dongkuii TaxID=2760089 RepID=UPI0015FDF362|nr:hypothetical protein [Nocardioides dongkuii]
MTPLDHDDVEDDLDQRLRRTLTAVADTVQGDPGAVPAAARRRPRRRRGPLVAAGAAVAALPLAAAAVVGFGPEHVDRIPPADPILSDSLDGQRYWVVDGRQVPRCEGHPSGIELVLEENNTVGQEWNTTGAFFGSPTRDGCPPTAPRNPPEHTYDADGGSVIGDGFLWMGALHPDVDQVRVSLGGGDPFDAATFEHEGGTYYVLEVPPGTAAFTVDYLVDGRVLVPPVGERAEHVVPRG